MYLQPHHLVFYGLDCGKETSLGWRANFCSPRTVGRGHDLPVSETAGLRV